MTDWNWGVSGDSRILFEWAAGANAAGAAIIPEVLAMLRERAPVSTEKSDAGRFHDSIGYKKITSVGEGEFAVHFVSTAPYARYVIEGTQGGQAITPKNAMALRWRENDGFKFARVVTRGDTAANTFNRTVRDLAAPLVRAAFKDSIVFVTV